MAENDSQFPGLIDDLAQARAGTKPPPVTIEDCQRTLDGLRHDNVVDRKIHIRHYEFMLGQLGAMGDGCAHHGIPILTERDMNLLLRVTRWVSIARERNGKEWLPHAADYAKSRLFWRIRSGKVPLAEAPPTAFSCPWYEVVEVAGPHDCYEVFFPEPDAWPTLGHNEAVINQCRYELLQRKGDEAIVRFGSFKYRVWRDTAKALAGLNWGQGVSEERRKQGEQKMVCTASWGWFIERTEST